MVQPLPVIYTIKTPRLVLRCWNPADAPKLVEAITMSVDHLRPWMPWASSEPETVEAKIQKIRQWRAKFDRGEDFFFGIFNHDETEVLGGIGFHNRVGAGAREIGYWIRVDHAGKGLMTEAAAALTRVGFEIDHLRRIEIHCDPANLPSAAIPRKLGYRHQLTIPRRVTNPKIGPRDSSIWVMTKSLYEASPLVAARVRAFDVVGNALL